MLSETEIALEAAKRYGEKYDAACKMLFHNKEILAPVLQAVVPEYQDCSIEEVIRCIDGTSICSDAVDDRSVLVEGLPAEMSSVSDKLITYDARFKAVNPKLTTESIQFYLYFDLEIQNDYTPENPKYPLIKRAVYYAARLLSAQLGSLSGNTDYDKLQKSYSIWICNERIPQELRNTVTSYAVTKRDVIGATNEPEEDYDLMNVIMIRRGNDEGKEAIFDYLSGIFTSNRKKVSRYVDVERNEKVKEDFEQMSGLGMSIAAKNYDRGLQQGMQQGLLQGMHEMSKVIQFLIAAGRSSEIDRITRDTDYYNQVRKELSI